MEAHHWLDRGKTDRKIVIGAVLQNIISVLPIAAFFIILLLQAFFPRRPLLPGNTARMLYNLGLFLVNSIIMRLLVPISLVALSLSSVATDYGLFNQLAWPETLKIVFSVVLLDLAIYWQHVATHKINLLWQLHKIHHADREMDVTTAVRFHPVELLLSLVYKGFCVVALGAPAFAVVLFELLLFIGPAFNHSNTRIPANMDRIMRCFFVTPDMHRAHHSIYRSEQDTNYGFFLPWWDRLFGTYTAVPRDGHLDMQIGIKTHQSYHRVDQMLMGPLRRD